MKLQNTSTSELWSMIALAVIELAKREGDSVAAPRVEIRRVNGGHPQATIIVALQDAQPGGAYDGSDIPPLLLVANATLNKRNVHHWEAIPVTQRLVSSVNRRAYRERAV